MRRKKPKLGAGRLRGRETVFSPNVPESLAGSAWSRSCFPEGKDVKAKPVTVKG